MKTFQYIAIAGNHPALSAAEIQSLLPTAKIIQAQNEIIIFECSEELPEHFLQKLGGTIKIAQLEKRTKEFAAAAVIPLLPERDSKIIFGISTYTLNNTKPPSAKQLGFEVKKMLKVESRSSRLVNTKEDQLSSIVVAKNKLLSKGAEIIIIKDEAEYILAKTIAVQDFESYNQRDYGRPVRLHRAGMLPPKLAQILINLSGPETKGMLLDPFCGSGTILQEAALLGYKNLAGADASSEALRATKENFEWLQTLYPQLTAVHPKLLQTSVANITRFIPKNSMEKIIFEGYLGPPSPQKSQIPHIQKDLTTLYKTTFEQCASIIKKEGLIVAAIPAWKFSEDMFFLPIEKTLPSKLRRKQFRGQTQRQTFLYGRPDQHVWREIIVLTLQP